MLDEHGRYRLVRVTCFCTIALTDLYIPQAPDSECPLCHGKGSYLDRADRPGEPLDSQGMIEIARVTELTAQAKVLLHRLEVDEMLREFVRPRLTCGD